MQLIKKGGQVTFYFDFEEKYLMAIFVDALSENYYDYKVDSNPRNDGTHAVRLSVEDIGDEVNETLRALEYQEVGFQVMEENTFYSQKSAITGNGFENAFKVSVAEQNKKHYEKLIEVKTKEMFAGLTFEKGVGEESKVVYTAKTGPEVKVVSSTQIKESSSNKQSEEIKESAPLLSKQSDEVPTQRKCCVMI